MNPDSNWSFRKSYKDARRRVKDVLRPPSPQPSSSGANLPPPTLSTQTLPIATQTTPPLDASLHAPVPTISSTSQQGVVSSIPPLLVTNISSSLRTNLPLSSNKPPPVTSIIQTAKDVGSVAWVGLGTALGVLKESSDVFPPLNSAVSGLLECLDILQVSSQGLTTYVRLRSLHSDGLQKSQ
jgi:hypothetical protein